MLSKETAGKLIAVSLLDATPSRYEGGLLPFALLSFVAILLLVVGLS